MPCDGKIAQPFWVLDFLDNGLEHAKIMLPVGAAVRSAQLILGMNGATGPWRYFDKMLSSSGDGGGQPGSGFARADFALYQALQ